MDINIKIEDKELLEKFGVRETKERAFETIIKKYREKLYWTVRRLVIDHDDANCILHRVIIAAWRGLRNFKKNSKLYSGLCTLAIFESFKFLEQQEKSAPAIREFVNTTQNKILSEKNFDANRLEWKLMLAIQMLPRQERAIFNLRYYEEMPYQEMAMVFHKNEEAIRKTYRRAAKFIEALILNNLYM